MFEGWLSYLCPVGADHPVPGVGWHLAFNLLYLSQQVLEAGGGLGRNPQSTHLPS